MLWHSKVGTSFDKTSSRKRIFWPPCSNSKPTANARKLLFLNSWGKNQKQEPQYLFAVSPLGLRRKNLQWKWADLKKSQQKLFSQKLDFWPPASYVKYFSQYDLESIYMFWVSLPPAGQYEIGRRKGGISFFRGNLTRCEKIEDESAQPNKIW